MKKIVLGLFVALSLVSCKKNDNVNVTPVNDSITIIAESIAIPMYGGKRYIATLNGIEPNHTIIRDSTPYTIGTYLYCISDTFRCIKGDVLTFSYYGWLQISKIEFDKPTLTSSGIRYTLLSAKGDMTTRTGVRIIAE